MSNLGRLRDFIADFTRLIDRAGSDEETVLAEGRRAVSALVATDDWLPDAYAQPHPQYYQRYLLHCDPLERGAVEAVSSTIGDVQAISNAEPEGVSISIHVYGGNIGATRRSVFDPATGIAKEFVSGYANEAMPNLWRGMKAA
jgi:predicted metal-dependent enzyme (double-stranded beta helix superfamily)